MSLPNGAHGALKLDGTSIPSSSLPKTVPRAELEAGKLVFTPVSGWEGDAIFTFRVVDAFGDMSATRTATIKVVPVIVEITSTPEDANYGYNVGETIRAELIFAVAVSVDTSGGTPRLKIRMDPAYGEKWVPYVSGSGTKTLTFEYRVVLPNESPRGIAVLANSLELNGGTIRSVATQADQPVANPGVVHDAAHRVDSRVDVCRRTSQVRDALVEEIGKPCGEITQGDLASHNVLWLELEEKSITSLKAGDFYGLEQIRNLYLDGNSLTTLPRGSSSGCRGSPT